MSQDYIAPNVRDALDIAEATLHRLTRRECDSAPGTLAVLKAAQARNAELAERLVSYLEAAADAEYIDSGEALDLLYDLYGHMTGIFAADEMSARGRARHAARTEPDPDELLDQQNDRDAEGAA